MAKSNIYILENNEELYFEENNGQSSFKRKITNSNDKVIALALSNIFKNKKIIKQSNKNGIKSVEFSNCIIHIYPEIEKCDNNYAKEVIDNFLEELSRTENQKKGFIKKNVSSLLNVVKNKSVVKTGAAVAISSLLLIPSAKKLEEKIKESINPKIDVTVSIPDPTISLEEDILVTYEIEEKKEYVEKIDPTYEYIDVFNERIEDENEKNRVAISEGNAFMSTIDSLNDYNNREIDNKDLREDYNLGSGLNNTNETILSDFLNSSSSQYVFKYASMYGVDPYIVLGVAMNETRLMHTATLPGGSRHNGYAWGIMQHETPSGRAVTAYNYNTKSYTTKYVTQSNAYNIETNIELGIMMLQEVITKYNGNVLVALQAYNSGNGVPNIVISKFMYEYNMSRDEVLSDIPISEFITEFKKLSYNAASYVASLPSQVRADNQITANYLSKYTSYGTGNYIEKVLSFYLGDKGVYNTVDNDNVVTTKLYIYEEDIVEEFIHLDNNNYKKVM